MGFKLGREKRQIRNSKNTPIIKKDLADGILGEANNDGSIYVDKSVDLNSAMGRKVVAHEMQHIKDMKSGKADYGDDYVRWNSTTYPRENGKIKYKGKWHEEGSMVFPWEKSAKKAENKA
tara:strand:+ start:128 stop:487 length:360 start_codon:yes stop_codon:yes gene_type:complete